MADEPISALTLLTSYSTADEVEILDVSDTTFASTGTNKRIQFSTLLTMAGGGGGSGTVTSVGLSLPSIIAVTGSPVSTSGTLTGTLATQTANTVFAGPSSGGVVAPTFRALVATDIPSLPASQITSGQISVAQGGTNANLSATGGAGNYVKQLSSGAALTVGPILLSELPSITYGAIQKESASTILGNPTGSPAAPSEITLYPNMGFVGTSLRGIVPIWAATSAGTPITNSTSSTSIFTGASSIGSLTIPANTLQIGSRLRFNIFGALSANATSSPTLTIKFLLGGATLASWTTPAVTTTYSGIGWLTYDSPIGFLVQAIGSSGKIIGVGGFNGFQWTANLFSNNALSAPPSQVTINTTLSQAIDVQFQWSVASASESIQLLGGTIYLD